MPGIDPSPHDRLDCPAGEAAELGAQELVDRARSRVSAIDLVHEHVTWFSAAGTPPPRVPFRVVK